MLHKVIQSFFKIGCIGFGGGSALIPVIEKEVVVDNPYISEEQYINHTVVSNITPGALPVKLGALIGYDIAKAPGMVMGALLTSIPGVLITLIFLSCVNFLGESALHKIEYASVGISIFIIFLLTNYIQKVLNDSKKSNFSSPAIVLMLATALLTCGKEIRQLLISLGVENSFTKSIPIFDISTVNILLLIFFLIFFTGGKHTPIRTTIAIAVSSIYLLIFGKVGVIDFGVGNTIFQLCMLSVSIAMVIYDSKREISKQNKISLDIKGLSNKCLPFLFLTLASIIICLIFARSSIGYLIINGIISTATSFGGGEAYLTVADGIFVAEGVVSSSEFYGQILPIANALPGSILVKLLAGIGFSIGNEFSLLEGWLLAILGLIIATATSCIVCIIVEAIYKAFSHLNIFKIIKVWILPVICGLLLSTIAAMLVEAFKICAIANLPQIAMIGFVICIYSLIYILHKKYHLHDVIQILISACLSLFVLMLYI